MDDVIPNRRTTYDWVIEIISFLGMIATCIPVFFYNKMGKDVSFPIHYNLQGKADGWGDRTFLFILILIAIALYVYLTFSEKFFKRFLYPVKIDEQNALSIYRIGILLRRHVKLFVMLIFAYMSNSFLYQALSGDIEQPYSSIFTWLLGLLMGSVVLFFIRMQTSK